MTSKKHGGPWPIRPTGQKAKVLVLLALKGALPAESIRSLCLSGMTSTDFYRNVLADLGGSRFITLGRHGYSLLDCGMALARRLADAAGEPLSTDDAGLPSPEARASACVHPQSAGTLDISQLTAGRYRMSPGTGDQRPPLLRAGSQDAARILSGGFRSRGADPEQGAS